MAFAHSIDAIKQQLCARLDELVKQLFPNATVIDHEWAVGDIHGSPGQSLRIHRGGHKAGWWVDWANRDRDKGDVLTLIAAGACQGDVKAAIPWAVTWLGLGRLTETQRRDIERKAEASRVRAAADTAKAREKMRGAARSLWLGPGSTPIQGTPADRYLMGRRIDIRTLGRAPGALRFHAAVWCAELERKIPAMLGVIQDAAGWEHISTHRTYLEIQPSGHVIKAPGLKEPKKTLGAYAGGHIPLWRGASGKPWRHGPEAEWVATGEGIEEGLSIALAMPHLRVVSHVSLGNLGEMHVPEHCGGLFIGANNDGKPEPIAALARALERLEARGVPHQVVRPPAEHKDFNDWLRALTAPAVTAGRASG